MRVLGLLLLAVAAVGVALAGPVIVKDGKPAAVIVTAEQPSDSAKRAVEELRTFVMKMSGAALPVQTDTMAVPAGQAALLVGRSKLTAGVEIPSGTDRDYTKEGFILKTQGNRVIVAGNEDGDYHGTEYAAYELLERLGCRWYYPGEFGQVIPKLATLTVPDINVTQRPSFAVRNIWMSGWADGTGEMLPWILRNKGSDRGGFAFPGDGTIQNLAPIKQYGKDYPDIYAMGKDGKRQDEKTNGEWVMLCTTNLRTIEVAAKTITDYFRAHPEANSYAFSAPDNNAVCYCPDCVARMHDLLLDSGIGESISDPYFNFVNNLAWKVNETFPDKYIVVLSYASRVATPEGLDRPWNPKIIIQLAQLRVSQIHPIGDPKDYSALRQLRTLKAWSRITPTMLIYDYDPHADLSRMPIWRPRALADDLRLYKANHVVGFTTEGQNTFFRTGLNYYIRTKLMWDVNLDVDKLLDDYYSHFFGSAAAPMKTFTDEIQTMLQATNERISWQPLLVDWTLVYPMERLSALGKVLDKAEALADTPEVKTRVRLHRILWNYMMTYQRMYACEHDGKYAEALVELEKLPGFIAEAQAIQPGLLPPDPGWVLNENNGLAHMRLYLTTMADRAGGKLGELLGRAPVTAQFLTDPTNIGLYEQWQRDDVANTVPWKSLKLNLDWGLSGYQDAEGYAYDGLGWYRFAMPVKKPAAGRAQLVIPTVYAEKIWVWVNGHMVTSPTNINGDPKVGPTPGKAVYINKRGRITLMVDIQDYLKTDAVNTFTVRMSGSLDRTQHRGFASIPFVWAPRP